MTTLTKAGTVLASAGCAGHIVLQLGVWAKAVALAGLSLLGLAAGFCAADFLARRIPLTKWEQRRVDETLRKDAEQRIVNERLRTYRVKFTRSDKDIN